MPAGAEPVPFLPARARPRAAGRRVRGAPYALAEGVAGFRRNGAMSAAAAMITMVTLTAIGGALAVAAALEYNARHLEEQIEVVAYLRDGLTQRQVDALRERLAALPGVRGLAYISKEDALGRLQQSVGEQIEIRDLLARNPLPASYVLTADGPSRLSAIAAAARDFPEVEDVSDGSVAASRLLRVMGVLRVAGAWAGGALALAALVIIAGAIRLTVLARRAEIDVMRLLGATAWFIRGPFLVEGAMTGACGAAGAVLFVAGAYTVVASAARTSLPFLPLPAPEQVAWEVSWKLLLGGVAIGILGSLLAVRKNVRV